MEMLSLGTILNVKKAGNSLGSMMVGYVCSGSGKFWMRWKGRTEFKYFSSLQEGMCSYEYW